MSPEESFDDSWNRYMTHVLVDAAMLGVDPYAASDWVKERLALYRRIDAPYEASRDV
jgi:hypothetical protein